MRTTIDLADDLSVTLKKRTARDGVSRDVGIVSGKGLSTEAASRSWEDLRSWSYDRDFSLFPELKTQNPLVRKG
jgi:hypothetical protein